MDPDYLEIAELFVEIVKSFTARSVHNSQWGHGNRPDDLSEVEKILSQEERIVILSNDQQSTVVRYLMTLKNPSTFLALTKLLVEHKITTFTRIKDKAKIYCDTLRKNMVNNPRNTLLLDINDRLFDLEKIYRLYIG